MEQFEFRYKMPMLSGDIGLLNAERELYVKINCMLYFTQKSLIWVK